MLGRHGDGFAQAHDGGKVLGTGTAPLFLRTAVHENIRQNALFDIQGADALRRMEFVTGKGQHIHAQRLYIYRNVTDCLYRVGVEPRAVGMGNGGKLRNGLHGADLVIRQHDGNKGGILTDRLFQLGRLHQSLRRDRQIGDLEALLLQRLGAVQNGVMLKRRGDQVLFALCRPAVHAALQRPVIRLGAAGGEVNLTRLGIQGGGDLTARLFHGGAGGTPDGINAAGVAVVLHQPRGHRLQYGRCDRCGGGVIGVNKAFFHCNTLPLYRKIIGTEIVSVFVTAL